MLKFNFFYKQAEVSFLPLNLNFKDGKKKIGLQWSVFKKSKIPHNFFVI